MVPAAAEVPAAADDKGCALELEHAEAAIAERKYREWLAPTRGSLPKLNHWHQSGTTQ
jgi:hypothetical protein